MESEALFSFFSFLEELIFKNFNLISFKLVPQIKI